MIQYIHRIDAHNLNIINNQVADKIYFCISKPHWGNTSNICYVASLSSGEQDSYLKLQRTMEIAQKRVLYAWVEKDKDAQGAYHSLPGYISAGMDTTALPKDFR